MKIFDVSVVLSAVNVRFDRFKWLVSSSMRAGWISDVALASGRVTFGLLLTLSRPNRSIILFVVSVFVVVSAVVGGFDRLKWLVSSLVGSDGTSGIALERGWVEGGVILTSVAILIEAQQG